MWSLFSFDSLQLRGCNKGVLGGPVSGNGRKQSQNGESGDGVERESA